MWYIRKYPKIRTLKGIFCLTKRISHSIRLAALVKVREIWVGKLTLNIISIVVSYDEADCLEIDWRNEFCFSLKTGFWGCSGDFGLGLWLFGFRMHHLGSQQGQTRNTVA